MAQTQARPLSPIQIWLMAARPRTLPAAVAPVLAASGLAFFDGHFRLGPALAALLGALLIQVGANFSNDLFDYQKGVDTHERLGPTRVTQAGLLTQAQVRVGALLVFALAGLCGVYLALVSGWVVVAIGLLSIAAAVAYTAGPYPLGYNGLGEVFVFLFFGVAAVAGTYYVQARSVYAGGFRAVLPDWLPGGEHPGGQQPARHPHRPRQRQALAFGALRRAVDAARVPGDHRAGLSGPVDHGALAAAARLGAAHLAFPAAGCPPGEQRLSR